MADDLGSGVDELLASLAHKQTLHRERAAAKLGRWLRALPAEPEASDLTTLSTIEAGVLAACEAEAWEGRQGGFLGARKLLSERAPADAFVAGAVAAACARLEDPEARVRLAVAEAFLALATLRGAALLADVHERLLGSIDANFELLAQSAAERKKEGDDEAEAAGYDSADGYNTVEGTERPAGERLSGKAAASLAERGSSEGGAGWKCLETGLKALERVVEGCKGELGEWLPKVIAPVLRSASHTNRFVREVGLHAAATLCRHLPAAALGEYASPLEAQLRAGLCDNWSQVRYAASTATRAFCAKLSPLSPASEAALLPPMCLNRYYVAEGVRRYSQQTWHELYGDGGAPRAPCGGAMLGARKSRRPTHPSPPLLRDRRGGAHPPRRRLLLRRHGRGREPRSARGRVPLRR